VFLYVFDARDVDELFLPIVDTRPACFPIKESVAEFDFINGEC